MNIPSRLVRGIALLAALVGTGSLASGFTEATAKSERGGTAMVTNQGPNGGGRLVTIEAKPGPIGVVLARTAIVVVDMQNDFGAKGGLFDRAGIDISMIHRAVEPTAKVLAAGRA